MIEYDPVSRPAHYARPDEPECIEAMRMVFGDDEVAIFCKLNAWKYMWRAPFKNKPEEDRKKAVWYIRTLNKLNGSRVPEATE